MLRECISPSLTKREIVLGAVAVVISLLFLFFAAYEMSLQVSQNPIQYMSLPLFTYTLNDVPQETLRIFYIVLLFSTPISAMLLIVGVLRHNNWLLLPWIVIMMVVLIMTCIEFIVIVLPVSLIAAVLGASIYIIFAVFAIYHKLETEEREEQQKQKRGVRMASGTEELDAATTYATLENE